MLALSELVERHAAVRERMRAAAVRAGRDPSGVTLVAVTKTWPAELVALAYETGMRHFGENRPEELAEKRPAVETLLGPVQDITWHMIGTVQSRKTALVAEHADVFHALDRMRIASRLASQLAAGRMLLPVFLEVNVSGETSKAGIDCTAWEHDATQRAELRSMFIESGALSGLRPCGLMTMAPWDAPQVEIREVFRRTRALANWLRAQLPGQSELDLSMGMTDDFELAIEEGATHVRVGRALFGERL